MSKMVNGELFHPDVCKYRLTPLTQAVEERVQVGKGQRGRQISAKSNFLYPESYREPPKHTTFRCNTRYTFQKEHGQLCGRWTGGV